MLEVVVRERQRRPISRMKPRLGIDWLMRMWNDRTQTLYLEFEVCQSTHMVEIERVGIPGVIDWTGRIADQSESHHRQSCAMRSRVAVVPSVPEAPRVGGSLRDGIIDLPQ